MGGRGCNEGGTEGGERDPHRGDCAASQVNVEASYFFCRFSGRPYPVGSKGESGCAT